MFFRPKVSTLVQELKDLDREEGANVETVRHALAKLEELCLQRAHALSTIDEDGLPALSKSLFSEDMTVRQAAAGCLQNIALHDGCDRAMVRLGVILPALAGCLSAPDEPLIERAAGALANLTCEPAHVEQIVRSGAVPRLLGGLALDRPAVTQTACSRALANLSLAVDGACIGGSGSVAGESIGGRCGGGWIGVASDARRRVLAELLDGCQALCELFADAADAIPPSKATAGASAHSNSSTSVERGAFAEGAGGAVVGEETRCLQYVAQIVRNISPGSEVRLGKAGVIPTLLQCLSASEPTRAAASAALAILAAAEPNRTRLLKAGAVLPLLGALRNANGARRESALVAHCLGDSESRTRTPPPLPLLRISSASSSPVPCPPVAQALSRICSAVRRPRRRRPRSPCSMQGASTSSWTACRNPAPADATAPLPTTAAHALHPQPPPLPTARSLDRGSAN